MPDAYEVLEDAELRKAFDVWSGYLDARTGEEPGVRARLRAVLESARTAAADGDPGTARALVGDLYDEAREAGLAWAPPAPRPCEADRLARDYAKDALPQVLPLSLRDRLDQVALFLSVTGRRLAAAPGIDAALREDILYVTARAGMALDLAHPAAARRELERLKAIARRCGVEH
ncbi:hypothetical protein [Streptomyces capillispiralis]|uniref:Uncharacterized protein n=1 Tax=Streptomyces capillispiralis TaxID=68182 RepID=A0A561T7S8_9ACTN|nr:hypothetical protein [Streptomyces capillispiralis]TWF83163.1 hypothetical protein FHX78_1176 [Streptomyces capillispiralis]GHH94600.1 hypothetical protein GCM10017779_50570 [Streptomyces capillispiralis]